jgi:hypothetical protein
MDLTQQFDRLPLWAVFIATVGLVALSLEGGYRIGKYRRQETDQEKEAPVGAIVAATLGLLAFMLAFTFSSAAIRFDQRRFAVLEEANAIGTASLRADLLPEPHATEIKRLLRDYVDVRIRAVQPGQAETAIEESSRLQGAIWSKATEVARNDSRSVEIGLFIQSLNEVIDLHSKRVMLALHNRLPLLVWQVLYFIAISSMAVLGYQQGLSNSRRSLAVLALMLAFTAVMLLIADLDRPQEGLLRVSQQSMIDLRESLGPIHDQR